MAGTPGRELGAVAFQCLVVPIEYAVHAAFAAAVGRVGFAGRHGRRVVGRERKLHGPMVRPHSRHGHLRPTRSQPAVHKDGGGPSPRPPSHREEPP
jgi:hypothetical protein